jgi:hypothetical protein
VPSVQVAAAELFRDEPLAILPLTRRDGRASGEPVLQDALWSDPTATTRSSWSP